MKNVMSFEKFHENKYYYETEPLNEKIDLSKIFKGKSPEGKRKAALKIINDHKTKKAAYDKFKDEDPDKAEKFVQFIMKKPYARYFKWDPEKKEFSDTGKYKSAVGES
jgi:hypothetical protein